MSSYPTSTSASGIWQLGDIPLFIQDGAWPGPGNLGLFMGGASGPANTQSNVIDFIKEYVSIMEHDDETKEKIVSSLLKLHKLVTAQEQDQKLL